jgi:hypothetical protein
MTARSQAGRREWAQLLIAPGDLNAVRGRNGAEGLFS